MKTPKENRLADFFLSLQPLLQTGGIVFAFILLFLVPIMY